MISTDVMVAEEFLETIDMLLWGEITHQSQSSIWMKPPCYGISCLRTSSVGKPGQCQVSRILRMSITVAWEKLQVSFLVSMRLKSKLMLQ
jgi:hypothetical protein